MGPPGRLRNGRGDRKLGRLAARTRLRRGHSPPSASAANLRFLSFVAASSFRNLKFKSRTRFIELLVVLRFRSSYRNMPRALTNFGIGPLEHVPLISTQALRDEHGLYLRHGGTPPPPPGGGASRARGQPPDPPHPNP